MPIAGGNINIDSTEGVDKIAAANIVTSSLTDTNEKYFFGISNNNTPTVEEFNVAFGDIEGHGVLTESLTISETKAIYGQYASLLLHASEVTGGFFISQNNSLATPPSDARVSGRDNEIYVLSAVRSNMKDRINKGTWQVNLSGSNSAGNGSGVLHLKDDSSTTNPIATPAGDRYNIVSCSSDGTIAGAASVRTFGFFYPDQGLLVFSGGELSSSIPGVATGINTIVGFESASALGFGTGDTNAEDLKNGMRFINCLQVNGTSLEFRDEEDQVSAQYFCRVRSGQMNFSNNPTFVSGSQNELRQSSMRDFPTTFITSIQLYNSDGDMVAVGNLSKPLKKDFASEATIKVELTY